MNWNRLLRRSGKPFDGAPCRAQIPGRPGVFDSFAAGLNGPDYRRPISFVVLDAESKAGRWEYR